jgi:hypothetical protein
MSQIVPAEFADPGSPKDCFPRRLKSDDMKDTRASSGLFAPVPQHSHRFVVERHMPGLATLCVPTLDGDEPTVESTEAQRRRCADGWL